MTEFDETISKVEDLRLLWRMVIDRAILDSCNPKMHQELIAWLASSDYGTVRELADLPCFREDLYRILKSEGIRARVLRNQLRARLFALPRS